jgi:hypothetical protein
MAARSPSRYGKYEIVAPLATGGMADLFLARQRGPSGFEALAVVKRIRQHLAANPEFVRLFLGEARLAAQLRHPNVVSVYDAGQESGEYFFVMEYVHGRDLRAILDVAAGHGRVITLDEALSIAVGVCAGLHHAHERTDPTGQPLGIVHRDISPSNVLVGFEGGVKLADFGIAKATQAATKEPGTNSLRGKLSYLSPEQCLGMPLDRRADLYAFSVVLYELTVGARPHGEAPSEFLALKQTLEAPVRPPSRLRPGYPEELERIVMRGLIRDRDKRWWSAREMQLELEQFARRRQLAISPVTVAKLMEELFADDLEAWQAAQDRGTDLAEYVAHSRTLSLGDAAVAETQPLAMAATQLVAAEPVPDAEPPPMLDASRRGKRLVAASVAVAMAASLVLVLVARRSSAPAPAVTAPAAAVTAPAVTAPTAASPDPAAAQQLPVQPSMPPAATPPPRSASTPPKTAKPAKAAARVRAPARSPKRPHPSDGWDPEAPVLPH